MFPSSILKNVDVRRIKAYAYGEVFFQEGDARTGIVEQASHNGQRIGNYRLVQLLGQGGFAEVYLAEHIHLNTQVAVKLLSCIGYLIHPFEKWIVFSCNCTLPDLFTPGYSCCSVNIYSRPQNLPWLHVFLQPVKTCLVAPTVAFSEQICQIASTGL